MKEQSEINMHIENTPSEKIDEAFVAKRKFFDEGGTLDYHFRKRQLAILKKEIREREDDILQALRKDLGKPEQEAYASEIGLVYRELDFMLKHLKKLMQAASRRTPLVLFPSKSQIIYEPKGVLLIISPWNYPFQLIMTPLIGAMAAGNTVILKPSEQAVHTARLLEDMIHDIFDVSYISLIQGKGETVVPELLNNHRMDHILFTGSNSVGKKVAKMAASKLTPITLELGGKSPAIIDKNVHLKVATKRVIWSKFFNCGQTCLSPDYVMVHESKKAEFLSYSTSYIEQFYGQDPAESFSYGRLISEDHVKKITGLMEGQTIYSGGNYELESRFFEPTLILDPDLDDPIMREEIFGPILPVLSWRDQDELLSKLRYNPQPLSCYVYSTHDPFIDFVLKNYQFGTGAINDGFVQFLNQDLPFGGVGISGNGKYRGEESFHTFSNLKSIMRSSTWIDPSIRYPKYSNWKMQWVKRLMKY